MGIEIIHHKDDRVGTRIVLRNGLQKRGPIRFGPACRDLHEAGARERFDGQKHIAHPAALVFVIFACGSPAS